MAAAQSSGTAPARANETTTSPIMRLAGRLAAAWETFRDHDKNGKGATTQADRDFSRRSSPGGLHDKIFELQPETLEEAMVALAVASDILARGGVDPANGDDVGFMDHGALSYV